jgi:hypothetical protein
MWAFLMSFLTAWSSTPAAMQQEAPRSAAAVAYAYASLEHGRP